MTNYTTTRLQTEEVDREALRWAGPFGYAVVQVLRLGDNYSDADFLALMERGRHAMAGGGGYLVPTPTTVGPAQTVDVTHPVAGLRLDPDPGDTYYARRVTPSTATRPGTPASPPGARDASGRPVRRVPR